MPNLFRRWWLGEEDRVAVDVQDARVVIASEMGRGRSTRETHSLVENELSGSIRNGVILDTETLSSIIRERLSDIDTRHSRLGVILPGRVALCVGLPDGSACSHGGARDVTRWASERLSLSPDVYHLVLLPSSADEGKSHGVIIAARRAVLDSWREVAKLLGCELTSVVPRACVLLVDEEEQGTPLIRERELWIDMTESVPSLYLYSGGHLVGAVTLRGSVGANARDVTRIMGQMVSRHFNNSAALLRLRVLGPMNEDLRAELQRRDTVWSNEKEIVWIADTTVPAKKMLSILDGESLAG